MFDWIGYLHLAKSIVDTGQPAAVSEEARLRCAVSRAYYAAFGRAAVYFTQIHGPEAISRGAEVHSCVAMWFKKEHGLRYKQIGKALDDLREWRNNADYESEGRDWDKCARSALIRAEDSISKLTTLDGAPPEWS
jgi:uncharacterized protein (UPF0332 family)